MARYLFVESRDPYESSDTAFFADLVQGSKARGNDVTFYLIQNGTFAAREGSKFGDRIERLLKSRVKILVDGFSVRERGATDLLPGVESIEMGQFVSLVLESGTKVIWH